MVSAVSFSGAIICRGYICVVSRVYQRGREEHAVPAAREKRERGGGGCRRQVLLASGHARFFF